MKKNIRNSVLIILVTLFSSIGYSQININKLSNKIKKELLDKKNENSNLLSIEEVVRGLKEALNVGVKKELKKHQHQVVFLKMI